MRASSLADPEGWGEPPASLARPQPSVTLQRLLRLAGARPQDRICVVGPEGLEALLALSRLGYDHAVCMGSGVCPGVEGACDLLLLTGPMAPAAFAATLSSVLHHLRDGGVLATREAGLQDDALIVQVLACAGRAAGWRVHDLAEGCLVAMQVVHAG